MTTALTRAVNRSAVISDCGHYRYRLDRWWGDGPRAVFIMLNPSTADADIDDPTIRRCMGFARAWGDDGLTVVNLFAYRATDPEALRDCLAPVGPENDHAIREAVSSAKHVVAAWGANSFIGGRAYRVKKIIAEMGTTLRCLGRTSGGHPRHPLYVRAAQVLEDYA